MFLGLIDPLLLAGPFFVPLLEEFADSLGGLAALVVDVPPGVEGGVFVAAALLDESVLSLVVVVDALAVGDGFLRGEGGTRWFLDDSDRRFSVMICP